MFSSKPNTPTLRFFGTCRPARLRDSRRRAFTLIELLMVIAVILILAGITFGISRGVQNAQARAKAKAELAVLSQALEQFKSANGDYPWAQGNPGDVENNGERLLKALAGYMEFERDGDSVSFDSKDDIPSGGPKSFIDLTRVSMNKSASALPDEATDIPENFHFIDPWGSPYVYRYKSGPTDSWERFGYVLFSMGPDGRPGVGIPATGILPEENDEAIDNIYAGE